ncbi:MAG: phenylalanine--tRNA ligase subunit beta, partial [Alphaproteobacteria bacterium]
MKFTISWLKDHLETTATLDEIVAALDSIGLEVEAVENPAEAMAHFRVAEILEAEPHPDADKLRLCKVRGLDIDGQEGEHQVVCGAPNAKAGLKGIFAPVGAYLPSIDLTLKKAKIRGVESHGMMVSEREMGFSDEHDGIIELTGDYSIGTGVAEVFGLDDPVIEIAITPNRPDCLGVRGIARDLAARGLGTLKADPLQKVAAGNETKVEIGLQFDAASANACPVFAGRQVSGVKNGPSPDWLQQRLKAIGLRPISALVDITNYISFDRGRPLHVYDAAKVKGGLHARLAVKGEDLLALDGETYKLTGDECVIADADGVVGLGGVMGGETSGSTDATTDVIIESAYFDPIRTAMTGRVHNLLSDARFRFERGVDPAFVEDGLELATQMVLELCGGTAGPVTVAGAEPHRNFVVDFPISEVKRLTGLELSADRIAEILTALEFGVEGGGETLKVSVPEWRPDVEGTADLVEEVARIHGLDNITSIPLPMEGVAKGAILTPLQKRVRTARRALAARGAHEAVTYSFMWSGHAKAFGGGNAQTTLVNPISSELDTMRPAILP